MPAPALAYDAVSVRRSGAAVVDDVTLAVAAGEFVALTGESGAGKTTLLKLANRLVEADAGTVSVDGEPVGGLPVHELRRRIGYAFQGAGLFPHWTVAENIGVTPRLLGQDRATVAARVIAMLDLVGLPADFVARYPRALSGGQASRVGLARAMAGGARLLLLDEPFGALDPDTRMALGDRLAALHRDTGVTVIMVTHDLPDALLRASRVIVMAAGRIAADATPAGLAASTDPVVRRLIDPPLEQAKALAGLAK